MLAPHVTALALNIVLVLFAVAVSDRVYAQQASGPEASPRSPVVNVLRVSDVEFPLCLWSAKLFDFR